MRQPLTAGRCAGCAIDFFDEGDAAAAFFAIAERRGVAVTIRVRGAFVTGRHAEELLARVYRALDRGARAIDLDLREVPVIDCGGIGLLLLCREVVEVCVICVAPGIREPSLLKRAPAVGVAKLSRFRRLKSSARNCRRKLSRKAMSFKSEKSQVARPGPVKVSLPKSP